MVLFLIFEPNILMFYPKRLSVDLKTKDSPLVRWFVGPWSVGPLVVVIGPWVWVRGQVQTGLVA